MIYSTKLSEQTVRALQEQMARAVRIHDEKLNRLIFKVDPPPLFTHFSRGKDRWWVPVYWRVRGYFAVLWLALKGEDLEIREGPLVTADRCQFCSFDPTCESDYCDEHRPAIVEANRKAAVEAYDRASLGNARAEAQHMRWILGAIAHAHPGLRIPVLSVDAHLGYAWETVLSTGEYVLVPR